MVALLPLFSSTRLLRPDGGAQKTEILGGVYYYMEIVDLE
jgi:hypothetical protein